MISREDIIGRWHGSLCGNMWECLQLSQDGTGTLKTVTINQEAEDLFRWTLSQSGEELSFCPVREPPPGTRPFYSELLYLKFKIGLRQENDRDTMMDILTLSAWHDAEVVRGGGREAQFPEAWTHHEFSRRAEADRGSG